MSWRDNPKTIPFLLLKVTAMYYSNAVFINQLYCRSLFSEMLSRAAMFMASPVQHISISLLCGDNSDFCLYPMRHFTNAGLVLSGSLMDVKSWNLPKDTQIMAWQCWFQIWKHHHWSAASPACPPSSPLGEQSWRGTKHQTWPEHHPQHCTNTSTQALHWALPKGLMHAVIV